MLMRDLQVKGSSGGSGSPFRLAPADGQTFGSWAEGLLLGRALRGWESGGQGCRAASHPDARRRAPAGRVTGCIGVGAGLRPSILVSRTQLP